MENGLGHFPDHKILEMLLFYAKARGDTNGLGHSLVDTFGSLSGVLDAPPELLMEIKGIGKESAILIKFVAAVAQAYYKDYSSKTNRITDAETAKEYLSARFLGKRTECLYIVGLGSNGKILFCDELAEGAPETMQIVPATVVKAALRVEAAKVILAHNHPHGICNPSRADVMTTQLLYQDLKRVGVELLDHIIVAPDGICSMRELKMLPGQHA